MITLKTILQGQNEAASSSPHEGPLPATASALDFEKFVAEYSLLLTQYGRVQLRCSQVITDQARQISQLQTEVMRLRAELMVSVTSLPFGREGQLALEDVLAAADLVICQTGCVSHDAYWRVQEHCKRTGKQCVLVDQRTAIKVSQRVSA